MARNYAFRTFGLLVLMCFLGATVGAPRTAAQDDSIDYNALLDGSLGYMPAQWMVSQGLLAEMDAANSTGTTILQGTSTSTGTISPSSEPSDDNRDDKENGAVLGTLIGGLLVPQAFNIIDDGLAAGVCKSLINGAGAMAGLVVGQEAGKSLYPAGDENDTTSSNNSSSTDSDTLNQVSFLLHSSEVSWAMVWVVHFRAHCAANWYLVSKRSGEQRSQTL